MIRQTSTNAAVTFTLFKKLPDDLQIMIWERACFPQIIQIKTEDIRARNLSPIPPILHACYASRDIALKTYTLKRREFWRPFYYNSIQDVILLKNPEEFRLFFWEYIFDFPGMPERNKRKKATKPSFRQVVIAWWGASSHIQDDDARLHSFADRQSLGGVYGFPGGIMKLLDKVDHFTLLRAPPAKNSITKQITKDSYSTIDKAILRHAPSFAELYHVQKRGEGRIRGFPGVFGGQDSNQRTLDR